ncbi:unnamed protein product [Prorocentrum cordatum]|uniref:Uncharacterized protein n=1 Tax=Prorocentrum cordatum TaxID=2364126 RepID=A0ABN9W8B3_9DINO|nr:unnamed protein product [Polarella glacialis]
MHHIDCASQTAPCRLVHIGDTMHRPCREYCTSRMHGATVWGHERTRPHRETREEATTGRASGGSARSTAATRMEGGQRHRLHSSGGGGEEEEEEEEQEEEEALSPVPRCNAAPARHRASSEQGRPPPGAPPPSQAQRGLCRALPPWRARIGEQKHAASPEGPRRGGRRVLDGILPPCSALRPQRTGAAAACSGAPAAAAKLCGRMAGATLLREPYEAATLR